MNFEFTIGVMFVEPSASFLYLGGRGLVCTEQVLCGTFCSDPSLVAASKGNEINLVVDGEFSSFLVVQELKWPYLMGRWPKVLETDNGVAGVTGQHEDRSGTVGDPRCAVDIRD